MWKYVTFLAPMIIGGRGKRSVRTLALMLTSGLLFVIGIVLITSGAFVWIATNFSVHLAFLLTGGASLFVGAAVFVYLRKTNVGTIAIPEGLKDDPLARYIPASVAKDPLIHKILSKIESNPIEASAAAAAISALISRAVFDEDDPTTDT